MILWESFLSDNIEGSVDKGVLLKLIIMENKAVLKCKMRKTSEEQTNFICILVFRMNKSLQKNAT